MIFENVLPLHLTMNKKKYQDGEIFKKQEISCDVKIGSVEFQLWGP
jgi:hypothetical protein